MCINIVYVYIFRLNQELKDMKKNPVSGIDVYLPSDSNIYLWHATLKAPSNSPYAGGSGALASYVIQINFCRHTRCMLCTYVAIAS